MRHVIFIFGWSRARWSRLEGRHPSFVTEKMCFYVFIKKNCKAILKKIVVWWSAKFDPAGLLWCKGEFGIPFWIGRNVEFFSGEFQLPNLFLNIKCKIKTKVENLKNIPLSKQWRENGATVSGELFPIYFFGPEILHGCG